MPKFTELVTAGAIIQSGPLTPELCFSQLYTISMKGGEEGREKGGEGSREGERKGGREESSKEKERENWYLLHEVEGNELKEEVSIRPSQVLPKISHLQCLILISHISKIEISIS